MGNALTLHNPAKPWALPACPTDEDLRGHRDLCCIHATKVDGGYSVNGTPPGQQPGPTITLARWPTSKTLTRWRPRPR
jgi:hypothetical protein